MWPAKLLSKVVIKATSQLSGARSFRPGALMQIRSGSRPRGSSAWLRGAMVCHVTCWLGRELCLGFRAIARPRSSLPMEVRRERDAADRPGAAAVQSAVAGLHPRSLSVLRGCARTTRCTCRRLALLASRHADAASRCATSVSARISPARTIARYGPGNHGRAGVPQHEPLDADAGSAGPHAPARSGRQGVHRAPGRGHASAHPVRSSTTRSIASRRTAGWT